MNRHLINAVKELMDRRLSVEEIASRLHESIPIIQSIIDLIT